MKSKYGIFFLVFMMPIPGWCAAAKGVGTYWQCIVEDSANKQWTAKSPYQKIAINTAFAECKKESQYPASCKASKSNCEGFNLGKSTKPYWQCTALDLTAEPWKSNFYIQREDAALAAKAFCKANSTIPDTCYINLVTCRNINEGDSL